MLTINPDKLKIPFQAKVLDLGCGEGRHIHNLHNKFNILAYALDLDFNSALKTKAGFTMFFNKTDKGGKWLVSSGRCEKLPFADQCLDLIICSEVLEHVPNYHQALLEMKRILKPQGQLVITVPRFLPEKICWKLSSEYSHEPGGHIRIFKVNPLRLEIERLGFKMITRHFSHGLHSPYWWLKCLNWSKRETWWPVRLYHRFLVWEITHSPKITRYIEKILNPLIGKSVVLYFNKLEEA